MKDQLTTVMEAIRLTQHILAEYASQARPRDHAAFLTRVIAVMDDEKLASAVRLLDPAYESPGLVPDDAPGQLGLVR